MACAIRVVVASASDWKVFRVSGSASTAHHRVPPSATSARAAGAMSRPASGFPAGSGSLHPDSTVIASPPAVRKATERMTARAGLVPTPSWDITAYLRGADPAGDN